MTTDMTEFYKDTVFLPKTDFPMRGDLPQKEPAILKAWAETNLYEKIRAASKGKDKWVLHWGPPYANGRAHMGHAFTKSLKDIVNRCKQMEGFDAPLVPGWDCHGLPIEWKIEEQYRAKGMNKDDVPVVEFRKECRSFAEHWVSVQREEFKRLGVEGDWDDPYLTMAYPAEAQIAREIMKFAETGQLYRGSKPVMWSPVERTALADAEIEYHDHVSPTIWVKFPVVEGSEAAQGAKLVIWTTTPWTIPANRAVSYNPDIPYSVFEVTALEEGLEFEPWAKPGDRLIIADKLATQISEQSQDQVAAALWGQAVQNFLDSRVGAAYKGDPVLWSTLDNVVKTMAQDDANANLSDKQLIEKAHEEVAKRFRVDGAKPTVTPKQEVADKRRPSLGEVPRTLRDAPAAADNSAADNEFANLDALQDKGDSAAFERALAKLTPDQQERYLRG